MKKYKIDKDTTKIMKGICIVIMLFHHLFTFSSWIHFGNYVPKSFLVNYLNSPTKLCVSVFAFITGWAFCVSNKKFKSIISRVVKFLLQYWIVLFIILLFAIMVCGYKPTIVEIILEMFGVSSILMKFCWYVNFYIISVFFLFISYKLISRNFLTGIIIGIIIPILFFGIIKDYIRYEELQTIINNLKHWYPCMSVGYICNEYNIFGIIEEHIQLSKNIKNILAIILIILCGFFRYYISGFDFIYGAILVFSFSVLIQSLIEKSKMIIKILEKLGEFSNNIWFLHCSIFSSITLRFIQPYIYWINNEFIIIISTIIILYIISIPLNMINNKIKQINF